MGKVRRHRVVEERPQQIRLAPGSEHLEVTEAGERGRYAAHHGPRLRCRMPVVEDVSHDAFAGQRQAQRPRGGYAEVVHGLAAQELAHRGAQHRQSVGGAGIGGRPRALELQGLAARRPNHLAKIDGPAIAELARPVAELMAAVAGGVGVHVGQHPIAGKHVQEDVRCAVPLRKADHLGHFDGVGEQLRRHHRRGRDPRIECLADLPPNAAGDGVRWEFASEAIIEGQRR